ncbi:hypothetical protein Ga0466249_002225 [Sporomusaceae bacterium BoRhaA]|uniref:hypothetical protein n=1 Tax=Pelorhabdus rhamnosifermentans TaxID=2772457 RepID=UPI001C05EDF1|nr:hypothetical protein [Pelorhabdus rhamnosifermentans]MBU2701114.1 hypothetical protein [Pelorhabdus rhamnosifermentans]
MKIDIQEIVSNTIKEMEESKKVETLLKENIEKVISSAVKDAVDGYKIKRMIEVKIEKQVGEAIKDVGFLAYNTFVADQVNILLHSVVKEDLANKLSELVGSILLKKRETIKLSEIVAEYRKMYEDMDYDEWQNLDDGHFFAEINNEDDGSFRWITIVMAQKEQKKSYGYSSSRGDDEKKINMRLMVYKDEPASIVGVEFEGVKLDDISAIRKMSDFEALLLNLYLNKTKVEIDIDEDDIETYVGGYED